MEFRLNWQYLGFCSNIILDIIGTVLVSCKFLASGGKIILMVTESGYIKNRK